MVNHVVEFDAKVCVRPLSPFIVSGVGRWFICRSGLCLLEAVKWVSCLVFLLRQTMICV